MDDSGDSLTSSESELRLSPSKTRRNFLKSISVDFSTHHYEEIVEILNKNKLLQAEVDDLTCQLFRAGKKLTTANERADTVQDREVLSAAEIQSLKDALREGDSRYCEKDARIAKLVEEKRELKLQLVWAGQTENSLNNTISTLRKDVHVAQCESAAVQAAVLTIEMQKLQSAMAKMKQQSSVALTERSIILSDLESTKVLLAESEERNMQLKKDNKVAKLEEEQRSFLDKVSLYKRKISELENKIEEISHEKLASAKTVMDAEGLATDSARRYDTMLSSMESKIERLSMDSQNWKAKYEGEALKSTESTGVAQKKEIVTSETIEHLQQELQEALNQILNASDLATEQQRTIDISAEKIKELDGKILKSKISLDAAKGEKIALEKVHTDLLAVLNTEVHDLQIELEKKNEISEKMKVELALAACESVKRERVAKTQKNENEMQQCEVKKRDKIIESLTGDQTIEIEKMVKVAQVLREELADQAEELEKRDKIIKASRSELADQISETEKRLKVIKALRTELTDQIGVTEKKEKEIETVKSELADQGVELEKRGRELKALKSELEDQRVGFEKRCKDYAALQRDLTDQVTETEKRNAVIESLRGDQASEIENMVKAVQVLKEELAGQVAMTEKAIKDGNNSRNEFTDQMDEFELRMKGVDMVSAELEDQKRDTHMKERSSSRRTSKTADMYQPASEMRGFEGAGDRSLRTDNKSFEELRSELAIYKDASSNKESTIEKMRLEIIDLNKQLIEKSKAVLAFDECNVALSDKESSFKNQLRVMMFEKKKVELELEKAQESGYALDLVSKQNISAITAEKDRLETSIKKLKSQLVAACDKTNENLTAFMAERQKLKSDIIRIQRDANLTEVSAKSDVEEMTAEKSKMHAEWLEKTGQFDILKKAADDSKNSADILSKINVTLAKGLQEMTRKAEGLCSLCSSLYVRTDVLSRILIHILHILSSHSYSPIISSYLVSTDLASELDNAETQAAERELALSSTVKVFNSKIDCLEKLLEESETQKLKREADIKDHLANFEGIIIHFYLYIVYYSVLSLAVHNSNT